MNSRVYSLFRSVVVLSDAAPPAALRHWLPRWDGMVKDRLGIGDGDNLHLLYGRALTLLSPALGPCAEELAVLGPLARELGLSVAVNLSLAEALEPGFDAVALLVRAMAGTVYLDARQAPESADAEAIHGLVRELRACGVNPALVGPVPRWLSWGLLEAPFLNAATVHMSPAGRAALVSLPGQGPDPFEIRHPFDPCKERFAVFAGPEGGLYPCHGLTGVEAFRIGWLHDDVPLRISAAQEDLFVQWAARGPGCLGCVEPNPESPLPLVCELHKAGIAGTARPAAVPAGQGFERAS